MPKKSEDGVGNSGELRAPLQTRAEEWGGWSSSSRLGPRCATQPGVVKLRMKSRQMKKWLKPFCKGIWMDSSSKKTSVWEGSWNQDTLKFLLVHLAYFLCLVSSE